ncbi:cysteine hydrolase [Enterovirga rhinocerotis]|uniref:Nicotinamidase-related amidase n=1 Tax=Enterovirga rhinocerotis TaxID=1339210 RepID=A0A4R7BJ01_9HYPH|nr:cysteine hydrolase [Enterovirga rhinocerotis]TDR85320.1 nicotinamidase-related amidase [Enterovirga rhinocerotis]
MMDFDPFARPTVHLCVDMQRMFAGDTEWHTPWFSKVLPKVEFLAAMGPASTIFARFVPVARADDARGDWRRYYRRWSMMTLHELAPEMVELVPELSRFVPPARVFDKAVYSPWHRTALHESLARRQVGTIIVSGGETDVCVLAAVLGAIDHGFHVVLAEDCVCSSSDDTHDASVTLYRERYRSHVSVMSVAEIIERWRPDPL